MNHMRVPFALLSCLFVWCHRPTRRTRTGLLLGFQLQSHRWQERDKVKSGDTSEAEHESIWVERCGKICEKFTPYFHPKISKRLFSHTSLLFLCLWCVMLIDFPQPFRLDDFGSFAGREAQCTSSFGNGRKSRWKSAVVKRAPPPRHPKKNACWHVVGSIFNHMFTVYIWFYNVSLYTCQS